MAIARAARRPISRCCMRKQLSCAAYESVGASSCRSNVLAGAMLEKLLAFACLRCRSLRPPFPTAKNPCGILHAHFLTSVCYALGKIRLELMSFVTAHALRYVPFLLRMSYECTLRKVPDCKCNYFHQDTITYN